MVKNSRSNAGDTRDMGLIPGRGKSPGGGHGNPLQYSCLGNPRDRGAWWATVHRVAESDTTQAHTMFIKYLGYTSVSLPKHNWHLGLDDLCLVGL